MTQTPNGRLFPPLPADTQWHACLICGGPIPASTLAIHDQWHHDISTAAIRTERRLDEIDVDRAV